MGKLLWLVGGTALGMAVWAILNAENGGSVNRVAEASDAASVWGAKERVTGTGGNLLGKAEQGFGKLTGDRSTQAQGVVDEAIGAVKDAAGKAAQALGAKTEDAHG